MEQLRENESGKSYESMSDEELESLSPKERRAAYKSLIDLFWTRAAQASSALRYAEALEKFNEYTAKLAALESELVN